MKKILCVIFALTMVLSLAACNQENPTTAGTQGTTKPTEAPKALNMAEVYTTITSGVTMPQMMSLDESMMLDLYGIRAEYCKQAAIYLCENSLRADEIWLLEATDAASMATLKTLMQNRLDQKDAESITYDPEQNAIVKAAQIIESGNYLVMIVSPDAAAIAEAFRSAAGI